MYDSATGPTMGKHHVALLESLYGLPVGSSGSAAAPPPVPEALDEDLDEDDVDDDEGTDDEDDEDEDEDGDEDDEDDDAFDGTVGLHAAPSSAPGDHAAVMSGLLADDQVVPEPEPVDDGHAAEERPRPVLTVTVPLTYTRNVTVTLLGTATTGGDDNEDYDEDILANLVHAMLEAEAPAVNMQGQQILALPFPSVEEVAGMITEALDTDDLEIHVDNIDALEAWDAAH